MAVPHSLRWTASARGAIALVVVSAAYTQPFRPLVVVGRSMSPTYGDGEIALTVPTQGVVERGDVVVVERPEGPIVKRVALIPGDPILQVRRGNEWRTAFGVVHDTSRRQGRTRYATVPEGLVYVVGDNLGSSMDSRSFGPVPLSEITRKVYRARAGRLRDEFWAVLARPEPRTW